MDNVVSAMEFREILESMLHDENERLRQSEQPFHPEFQLIDGMRKINVPDEGTIILKSDEKRINPSISLFHLRKQYREWLDGNFHDHSTFWARNFLKNFFQSMESDLNVVQKSMEKFVLPSNPETNLGSIVPCICKTGRNQEALADVPHREILDLSVYYRIGVDLPENMKAEGSVVVSNQMLDLWNSHSDHPITEETLYASACENEKKLSRIIDMTNMDVFMQYLLEGNESEENYVMPEAEYGGMYVVTNLYKQNGAVNAFLGDNLSEFVGSKELDFLIIPSSIHEAILVADNGEIYPEELSQFVTQMNGSEVEEDEVLSDTVYRYDHRSKSIQIAYSPDEVKQEQAMDLMSSETYYMGQPSYRRGR